MHNNSMLNAFKKVQIQDNDNEFEYISNNNIYNRATSIIVGEKWFFF